MLPSDDLQKLMQQVDVHGEGPVTPRSTSEHHTSLHSHLLSDESQLYNIKIPVFSGDGGKNEITYTQWKYEVRCLIATGRPDQAILLAMRRSVRGTAAEVMRYLGETATVTAVLQKYDVIFGNVLSTEQMFEQFYSAKQKLEETIAGWGCRLEELLSQLREKGALTSDSTRDMLRSKFWMGLQDDHIKNATRHHFDSGATYEELFRAMRTLEMERASTPDPVKKKSTTAHVVQQSTTSSDELASKLDQVLKMCQNTDRDLKSVSQKIAALEKKQSTSSQPTQPRQTKPAPTPKRSVLCDRCGRFGHEVSKCHATRDYNGRLLND